MIDCKLLGLAIRKRRRELDFCQDYLARYLGMSRSYICEIEKGKKNFSVELYFAICKGLKCNETYLFELATGLEK